MSNSGIYVGTVRHRRFTPIKHDFSNEIFMPLIDLDDIEQLAQSVKGFSLKKWGLACFYYQDYLNGTPKLKAAAQEKIRQLTGEKLEGKVLALCQLRYMGLYFSPVNFYYLYDVNDNLRYLLAEVSNTPWYERHYYAIPYNKDANSSQKNWQHKKAFHVSPFNPMQQDYVWKISAPKSKALIHLSAKTQRVEFDATLILKKQPFTSDVLRTLLLKTPIMTIKVVFSIYWQALKLWLKGAHFYSHPKHSKE